MKITAPDLMRFGIVDGIVAEPAGGAHRHPEAAISAAGEALAGALDGLHGLSRQEIRARREQKFLAIGRNL
jgi:acetyl-CoA carboxylase carboxyl transferase subunit alpha